MALSCPHRPLSHSDVVLKCTLNLILATTVQPLLNGHSGSRKLSSSRLKGAGRLLKRIKNHRKVLIGTLIAGRRETMILWPPNRGL